MMVRLGRTSEEKLGEREDEVGDGAGELGKGEERGRDKMQTTWTLRSSC